ncbi:MAG: GNAT family N-acetyltransferase [Candidatus Tumulicola sp.]
MTSLVELRDADFEWILERQPNPGRQLTLPPEGIDDPATLIQIRKMVRRLEEANCAGRWMIVSRGEVVGLCSYKVPPKDGRAEIGYGVAEKRRRLGHATRAVAAVIRVAETDPQVRILTAETSINNAASLRVLEKNGFCRVGTRFDPEDGELILWSRIVS